MKNRKYLYIGLVVLSIIIALTACGSKKGGSDGMTTVVQPDSVTSQINGDKEKNGQSTENKSQVNKPEIQVPKPEATPNDIVSNSQDNFEDIEDGDLTSPDSQAGKVKTNIITSDLEYDKLPDRWEEMGSGAADAAAYYSYAGNNNSSKDSKAAIFIESFDGEKRYNTSDGIRERLQGRHQSDGLKNLTVTKARKGIFEYTYSFVTENDGKEYIGYIFEEQGATWEIGFFENGSLSSTEKDRLKKDFNKMINSCRIVQLEGDVA
ncbi:MAG TPA: hypothetical protein VHT34_11300 [Clostridia bacterium]|nr:hypothetical protein [Clostridia bacterium]